MRYILAIIAVCVHLFCGCVLAEGGSSETSIMSLDYAIGGGPAPESCRTNVQISVEGETLVLEINAFDPEAERNHDCQATRHDSPVWDEECVEFFLATCAELPESYYHIGINPKGTVYDAFLSNGKVDIDFDLPANVTADILQDRWRARLEIPLAALNHTPMTSEWCVNVGRESHRLGYATWAPVAARFHEPAAFASVFLPKIAELSSVAAMNERLRDTVVLPLARRCNLSFNASETTLDIWLRAVREYRLAPAREMVRRQTRAKELRSKMDGFLLAGVDAGEKTMRNDVPETVLPCIDIHLAQNELESASFAVVAPDEQDVRVEIRVELPLNFTLYRLGYVPIVNPTPGGERIAGDWPDIMIPMKEAACIVKNGTSQLFRLVVEAAADTPPGIYEGIVHAISGELEQTLQVSVHVYDVTLPVQGALKTIVCDEPWRLNGFFKTSEALSAANEDMCRQALRNRFCEDWRLPWEIVFDGDNRLDEEALAADLRRREAEGATTFRLANDFFVLPDIVPEATRTARLKAMQAFIEHHPEYRNRFYMYIFDEPGPNIIPAIRENVAFIRQSMPSINIIGTTQWRALADAVNWWIPVNTHLNSASFLAFMLRRVAMGDEFWMYTCFNTSGTMEADNWKIDAQGVTHRALGWQLWRFGCTGYLYWNLSAFGTPDDNCWTKPDIIAGCNGDGYMFYPPKSQSETTLYPSLRLDMTREGFDDYELLALLAARMAKLASTPQIDWTIVNEAYQLLESDSLIHRTDDYDRDWNAYAQRHAALLKMLERIK